MISIYYPRFLTALHYAGVFAAILLVIYPALMVWSGRYWLKSATGYQVRGGKGLVILTLLFGLGVIMLEILTHLNALPNPLHDFELIQ